MHPPTIGQIWAPSHSSLASAAFNGLCGPLLFPRSSVFLLAKTALGTQGGLKDGSIPILGRPDARRAAAPRPSNSHWNTCRRLLRRRVFAKINMSTLSNQRRASWGLIPSRGSLSGAHAARRLAAGCPSANILSHCCPALLKSPHCLTFLI